jgi:hypothetical protein
MDLQLVLDQPQVAGPLALFPVYSNGPVAPDYLPGPRATDQLTINEQDGFAEVGQLTVINAADRPVLLVEGDTVLGAKQNRTLNVSVLIAARGTAAIPVSCVEAGRWGAPRAAGFSPRHAPGALRGPKTASVSRSVARGTGRQSNQGEVWENVGRYAAAFSVDSPTSALEDVHRSVERNVNKLDQNLRPSPDQRGVVVAIGSTVRSIDLFDKPETLDAYWEQLVHGYAVDALAQPDARATATLADAKAFVALMSEARVTDVSGVGLGEELHLTSTRIAGTGLRWAGAVCHLSAFAA